MKIVEQPEMGHSSGIGTTLSLSAVLSDLSRASTTRAEQSLRPDH